MSSPTANPTGQNLVITREINAPAALVWRALTDFDQLKQWMPFFPNFEARAGFAVEFLLGKDKDHQYLHQCEVTEVIAGKKLSYTWHYKGFLGNSIVTYELIPDGEKTQLTLTHTITEPFPADNSDFASQNFAEGWNYTADGLKKFLEKNN